MSGEMVEGTVDSIISALKRADAEYGGGTLYGHARRLIESLDERVRALEPKLFGGGREAWFRRQLIDVSEERDRLRERVAELEQLVAQKERLYRDEQIEHDATKDEVRQLRAAHNGEVCVDVQEYADKLREKLRVAEKESDRLTRWLYKIDGGDHPCTDEGQLRQWAYDAVTLRREPSDG